MTGGDPVSEWCRRQFLLCQNSIPGISWRVASLVESMVMPQAFGFRPNGVPWTFWHVMSMVQFMVMPQALVVRPKWRPWDFLTCSKLGEVYGDAVGAFCSAKIAFLWFSDMYFLYYHTLSDINDEETPIGPASVVWSKTYLNTCLLHGYIRLDWSSSMQDKNIYFKAATCLILASNTHRPTPCPIAQAWGGEGRVFEARIRKFAASR